MQQESDQPEYRFADLTICEIARFGGLLALNSQQGFHAAQDDLKDSWLRRRGKNGIIYLEDSSNRRGWKCERFREKWQN